MKKICQLFVVIIISFVGVSAIAEEDDYPEEYFKDDTKSALVLYVYNDDHYDVLKLAKILNDKTDRPTIIKSLSEIASDSRFDANTIVEKIRKAEAHYATNNGVKYVTLWGDSNIMPVTYVNERFKKGEKFIDGEILKADEVIRYVSDYAYANVLDKSGNYFSLDPDGDNISGEYSSSGLQESIDINPDIIVGRVPSANKAESMVYLKRKLNYELGTNAGYNNILYYVASDPIFQTVNGKYDSLMNELKAGGKQVVTFPDDMEQKAFDEYQEKGFHNEEDYMTTEANKIINNKLDGILAVGHGSEQHIGGFYFSPSISLKSFKLNYKKDLPPSPNAIWMDKDVAFVYADSCHNAAFAPTGGKPYLDISGNVKYESSDPPYSFQPLNDTLSLAENMLVKNEHGTLVFVGGSGELLINISQEMFRPMVKGVQVGGLLGEAYFEGQKAGIKYLEGQSEYSFRQIYAHLHRILLLGDGSSIYGGAELPISGKFLLNTSLLDMANTVNVGKTAVKCDPICYCNDYDPENDPTQYGQVEMTDGDMSLTVADKCNGDNAVIQYKCGANGNIVEATEAKNLCSQNTHCIEYKDVGACVCPSCTKEDVDGDTVGNEVDNCPFIPNEDQTDTDSDKEGDVCDSDDDNDEIADQFDNCPINYNIYQLDNDHDKMGDECDPDDDNDSVADVLDTCPFMPDPENDPKSCEGIEDSDGDTMPDVNDNCPFTYNPLQEDFDHDGAGNYCDSDEDNDGIDDGKDNCKGLKNPDQANVDVDALGDACDPDDDEDGLQDDVDNCAKVKNADQKDSNNDGIGDVCSDNGDDADGDGIQNDKDNCPTIGTKDQSDMDGDGKGNLCDTDADGDGICNVIPKIPNQCVVPDNCPWDANADQKDTDGDGVGDVCEPDKDSDGVMNDADNCPKAFNPMQEDADENDIGDACQSDVDKDGIDDSLDNCPSDPNADQLDTDEDKQGNVCDVDMDNDGVLNDADNCPWVQNPLQLNMNLNGFGDDCEDADEDGDGIYDDKDNCPNIPNQTQTDYDEDGIGDKCDDDKDNDGFLEDDCDDMAPWVNPAMPELCDNYYDDNCDGQTDEKDCEEDDDMDNDGIPDDKDNCKGKANPDQINSDNDKMGDICDFDDDNDGKADAVDCEPLNPKIPISYEICKNKTDDNCDGIIDDKWCGYPGDYDADGIPNGEDNCPGTYNPKQENSDGDGLGGYCDNCPHHSNKNQIDNNKNGFGDMCDPDPNMVYCSYVENEEVVYFTEEQICQTLCAGNPCAYQKVDVSAHYHCKNCYEACSLSCSPYGVISLTSCQYKNGKKTWGPADVCTQQLEKKDADAKSFAEKFGYYPYGDNSPDCMAPYMAAAKVNITGQQICEKVKGINADDHDGDGVNNNEDYFPKTAMEWIDSDGDGIGDNLDAYPNDPSKSRDTDGDGIDDDSDDFPFDPTKPEKDDNDEKDADGDGVFDNSDNCQNTPNPYQDDSDKDGKGDMCDTDDAIDTDKDGVPNKKDNCKNVPNTSQTNMDGDMYGDACDDDIDGDGFSNNVDNCPAIKNPFQEDSDNDNIGNVCDSVDDTPKDSDGDKIPDVIDNCPSASNPSQADTDGDGLGDACDIETQKLDSDGDGYADDIDNCPNKFNPDQTKDMDGDGKGDCCDDDTDGDGLLNTVDKDDDNDNMPDDQDAFPLDKYEFHDWDNDGFGDKSDPDIDGDGFPNEKDFKPYDNKEWVDADFDGHGDNADMDDDNDGVLDKNDAFPLDKYESHDWDNDGFGDNADTDDDNDGYSDDVEITVGSKSEDKNSKPADYDGDLIPDLTDDDDDNDGVKDNIDAFPQDNKYSKDTDSDKIPDETDPDKDGDTVLNKYDLDELNSGITIDPDWDKDGVENANDTCPFMPNANQDPIMCKDYPDYNPTAKEIKCAGGEVCSLDSDCQPGMFCKGSCLPGGTGFGYDNDDPWWKTNSKLYHKCCSSPFSLTPCEVGKIWKSQYQYPEGSICKAGDDCADKLTCQKNKCVKEIEIPVPSDWDNDGIFKVSDNCPCVPNPDQIDANKNGIGDICEGYNDNSWCTDDKPNGISGCGGMPCANNDDCLPGFDCYKNMCATKGGDASYTNNIYAVCCLTGDESQCDYGKIWKAQYKEGDKCTIVPNILNFTDCPKGLECINNICTKQDVDGDGIIDDNDNCLDIPNADQNDDDKDGFGDVCDVEYQDDDKDGIINKKDNCAKAANPDQKDSDKDGIGDACDKTPLPPAPPPKKAKAGEMCKVVADCERGLTCSRGVCTDAKKPVVNTKTKNR